MALDNESDENLWICIPTDGKSECLEQIGMNSGVSENRRLLIRTDDGPTILNWTNLWTNDSSNINIQKWWNFGIKHCLAGGGRYLALLNDDVIVQEGQLQNMLNEMLEQNAVMATTALDKNGWGHAFLLDLNYQIFPDERFRWKFGDLDLWIRAKKMGRVVHTSIKIEHLRPNARTESSKELQLLDKADRKKFYFKHPEYLVASFLYRSVFFSKGVSFIRKKVNF